MTTGRDQVEMLQTAATLTRGRVSDPRFEGMANEAMQLFGGDLQGHVGRADTSELFTPLEVWTGYEWEPGAFIGLQDRGVVAWGKGVPRSQVIPRSQVKHVVETDVQPTTVTLWVDCEQPISMRVQRFAPGMNVPEAVHDALRPYDKPKEDVEIDDREDLVCPSCGGAVREGADFCPHCGHPMNPAKKFNKMWLLALIPVLVFLIVLGVLLLGQKKDKPKPLAKATATATAKPSATVKPPTGIDLPRDLRPRLAGPRTGQGLEDRQSSRSSPTARCWCAC